MPIVVSRSRMIVSRPANANARATARPTTPAPTTTASTSPTSHFVPCRSCGREAEGLSNTLPHWLRRKNGPDATGGMNGRWCRHLALGPEARSAPPDCGTRSDMLDWIYYRLDHWSSKWNPRRKRAIQNYRARLGRRGLARFEVIGRDADRDLIRSLARQLADGGPEASRLRAAVNLSIAGEPPRKGGILAALRRSPLVGADLEIKRPREEGRKTEI